MPLTLQFAGTSCTPRRTATASTAASAPVTALFTAERTWWHRPARRRQPGIRVARKRQAAVVNVTNSMFSGRAAACVSRIVYRPAPASKERRMFVERRDRTMRGAVRVAGNPDAVRAVRAGSDDAPGGRESRGIDQAIPALEEAVGNGQPRP
jgi:hypothetical protein